MRMKVRSIFFILYILFIFDVLHADKLDQSWDKVTNMKNQVSSGAGKFWEGTKQAFGVISDDYIYNYRVWNDTPGVIYVAEQNITGVLGAKFKGNIIKKMALAPNSNSGDSFYKRKLYVGVWLVGDTKKLDQWAKNLPQHNTWQEKVSGAVTLGLESLISGLVTTDKLEAIEIFNKNITVLGKKNDPNIYYYRAYTNQGNVKGEYLGVKGVSNEFSGVFYNGTKAKGVAVNFEKDGKEYTASLEPESFSLLSSTSGVENSIRPPKGKSRGFQFLVGGDSNTYLPIASEGIAVMVQNPKTKKLELGPPMTYTYEVYTDKTGVIRVGIQGLAIGNYTQPASERVRDINPIIGKIWFQSVSQAEALAKKAKDIPETQFFVPSDQVWMCYKTEDYALEQKLEPGKVFDFTLLRPQLKEKNATLYIASLRTDDDKKAKQFLDRLSSGKIGMPAISTDVDKSLNKDAILSEVKPNQNGYIKDDVSGVSGYILLNDTFFPQGVGTGPFYYALEPGNLQIGQLLNTLYLKESLYDKPGSLKSDVKEDLIKKIKTWITEYPQNEAKVTSEVKQYLLNNGNQMLLSTETQAQELNDEGNIILDLFLNGAISIKNPPVMRQAGINYYVFGIGQKPKDWPGESA